MKWVFIAGCMAYTQTEDELRRHLQEQLQFLQASCDAYDADTYAEAKRIATSLRVLFRDTSQSVSLAQQLGLKQQLFLSTCSPQPSNLGFKTSFAGLIQTFLGAGTAGSSPNYYVPLDNCMVQRNIPFDEWWDQEIILIDTLGLPDESGNSFTRWNLVDALANTDGGSHIDPKLKTIYAELSRNNSLGRGVGTDNGWMPMQNPALATVRQIGHEVLKTLLPAYAKQPLDQGAGLIIGGIAFN